MTSPTPPEAPFDKAAHAFADSMESRYDMKHAWHSADGKTLFPYWRRWALVEAFAAGRASVQGEAGASADKLGGRAVTESDPRIVALLARIASEPERAATFICAVVNVAVAVERASVAGEAERLRAALQVVFDADAIETVGEIYYAENVSPAVQKARELAACQMGGET